MSKENAKGNREDFLEFCSAMKSPDEFNHFFSLFLTFEEREMMISRYLIIKALLENRLTQREIAETYKVSIAQITRGSNALKIIDPQFKEFLENKLTKHEEGF